MTSWPYAKTVKNGSTRLCTSWLAPLVVVPQGRRRCWARCWELSGADLTVIGAPLTASGTGSARPAPWP